MAGTIHLKMATIVYKMGLPETENEAPPRELGRLHGLEPREEVDVAAVEVVLGRPLAGPPCSTHGSWTPESHQLVPPGLSPIGDKETHPTHFSQMRHMCRI